jgi:hypothetical protein
MKIKLWLKDWVNTETNKSIYGQNDKLTMSDFHSGSVFNAEIKLDEDHEAILKEAILKGLSPVFDVLPNEEVELPETVIYLKPENEKNNEFDETKCFIYSDNECRKSFNRDCLKCAINSYKNLYSFNWNIQDKLLREIAELKKDIEESRKKVG